MTSELSNRKLLCTWKSRKLYVTSVTSSRYFSYVSPVRDGQSSKSKLPFRMHLCWTVPSVWMTQCNCKQRWYVVNSWHVEQLSWSPETVPNVSAGTEQLLQIMTNGSACISAIVNIPLTCFMLKYSFKVRYFNKKLNIVIKKYYKDDIWKMII